MEPVVSTQPPKTELQPLASSIANLKDISIMIKGLLYQFRDSYATERPVSGFVDAFEDLLDNICSHQHLLGEKAFPSCLALREVAARCYNALERFINLERPVKWLDMKYEPGSQASPGRGGKSLLKWKQNRVNALVADLIGHFDSIRLLSQLHNQNHAE